MDASRGDMMGARLRLAHKIDPVDYQRDCRASLIFFTHNYLDHLPTDRQAPILEIGSGLGQFLSFLKHHGFTRGTGIDLSRENVEFCRTHGHAVVHADAIEYLASVKGSLGAIVMNDVIEHIPKDRLHELLDTILEGLCEGGVFILKTINMANPILGAHSRYNDFTHETGWTEESLREVLEHAGFERVQVLPSNLFVFYRNPLNHLAWGIAKLFDLLFLCYFRLHGRGSTHIFSKNLIAVAKRGA